MTQWVDAHCFFVVRFKVWRVFRILDVLSSGFRSSSDKIFGMYLAYDREITDSGLVLGYLTIIFIVTLSYDFLLGQ